MSRENRHKSEHSTKTENRADEMSIDQDKSTPIPAPYPQVAPASLDGDATEAIARQLKSTYGQLLNEPVPDRFLKLLKQLGNTDDAEQVNERAKKSSQNKG
jgi:Anti-sigma factor NepR